MASDPEKPGTDLVLIPADGTAGGSGPDPEAAELPGLSTLPKELGVMLLSAGVVGFVMPGPGTPAIIAGGLVLWPNGFGRAEVWFRRRFPSVHRDGMKHLKRFLADLERRYPGSVR